MFNLLRLADKMSKLTKDKAVFWFLEEIPLKIPKEPAENPIGRLGQLIKAIPREGSAKPREREFSRVACRNQDRGNSAKDRNNETI